MKILCVEDDEGLGKIIQRWLAQQHYQVDLATNGQMGWDLTEAEPYDLILLDWMLPQLTGIELCQRLRASDLAALNPNRDTPVLMMTATDAVTHKIQGLNAGADDYMVKPIDLEELLARIHALWRRQQGSRSPHLQWGELVLHPQNCVVTYQGRPIALAAKEYELLELFLRYPTQLFSLDRLLIKLWPLQSPPTPGAVRTHIKRLRQKLIQAGAADPIETLYKQGYQLKKLARSAAIAPLPAPAADRADVSRSPTGSPPASTDAILPNLWPVWQSCWSSYGDRLTVIQQAIAVLEHDALTADQQVQVEREAHTLIGSLGTFGLLQAAQKARQIQQILKQPAPLDPVVAQQLQQLCTALWQGITQARPPAASAALPPPPSPPPPAPPAIAAPVLTVLIVDDDDAWAERLAQESLTWGWRAEIAPTVVAAQPFLQAMGVDVLVLDINVAETGMTGQEFLARVHDQYPDLPVVILTAEDTLANRVAAARFGSHCFLAKPLVPAQVLSAVRQLWHQQQQTTGEILVVDDDPALLHLLQHLLGAAGYHVTSLSDPQQFWSTLEQTLPDLLIVDVELGPSGDAAAMGAVLSGVELCQVIRHDPRWNRLPVLFLSTHTDVATWQRSFAAGADDFLTKPVVAADLLTRIHTRLDQRKLWQNNDRDELTGLNVRRQVLPDLLRLIRLARRQNQPLNLVILDLDHFKQVNDQYGHAMGDRVLSDLGQLLQRCFRAEDVVGRWGGEEFMIGMYGITQADAMRRLEDLQSQLQEHVFATQAGLSFQVTFSAGLAQLPEDGTDFQMLYDAADRALYQAKATGRNRIVIAAPLSPPP